MAPGPAAVKVPFERPRQNKLPPRFAKQRENNRLQKAAQQQQHVAVHNDVSEMNKINQSVSLFPIKGEQHIGKYVNCVPVREALLYHFSLNCTVGVLMYAECSISGVP
jgi:hypothetical protein